MTITSTGEGLHVLIRCDSTLFHHDWMAFASWYSLTKNLPDATISVLCSGPFQYEFLRWAKKVDVNFITTARPKPASEFCQSLPKPTVVIQPVVMAVRELVPEVLDHLQRSGIWPSKDEEAQLVVGNCEPWEEVPWLCSKAADNDWTTFISYAEGCAKFVTSRWIHNERCPFNRAVRMRKEFMSCNEVRILKLWQQLGPLYSALSRG